MTRGATLLKIGVGAILAGAVTGAVAAWLAAARPEPSVAPAAPTSSSRSASAPLAYEARPIGDAVAGHPVIAHVAVIDLDADGLADVVACDGQSDSIRWLRQSPGGVFTESRLGDPVAGPVHVAACDLDGDDDLDLLIASMGIILPNNDRVGSVVVLENLGGGNFRNRVLLENTARVTDVRDADLNGDGRIDLVVGQFGYLQGEIRWMENLGGWQFRSHLLASDPGTIHTPVADFDRDGRPDFAALVSQDAEEVRVYRNLGHGNLQPARAWRSLNRGWGSSGLEVGDVNGDDRLDLVYTNGDGFEAQGNLPTWHGLQWLENTGAGFTYHRIDDFPGGYSPVCVDLDGDGHNDIVAVSAFNNWQDPAAASMAAWLNRGNREFTRVILAHAPTHLITVAAGDLDGDGVPELVTGGFHVYPPWTNLSRLTLWKRR